MRPVAKRMHIYTKEVGKKKVFAKRIIMTFANEGTGVIVCKLSSA